MPVQYVTTKGGNKVAVYKDSAGRVWMVDKAGDVFLDTGDPDVGVFAIDASGNMINYWEDGGETKSKVVGNVEDLWFANMKGGAPLAVFTEDPGSGIPVEAYMNQNGLTGDMKFPPYIDERMLSREEQAKIYSRKMKLKDLPPEVAQRLMNLR